MEQARGAGHRARLRKLTQAGAPARTLSLPPNRLSRNTSEYGKRFPYKLGELNGYSYRNGWRDERIRAQAQKRGGGQATLRFVDAQEGHARYRLETGGRLQPPTSSLSGAGR